MSYDISGKYLTPEEVKRFISKANEADLLYAALFVFQYVTLARIEEARLTVRDNIMDKWGKIRPLVKRPVVKKRRPVMAEFPVPDRFKPYLEDWLRYTYRQFGSIAKDDLVFITGIRNMDKGISRNAVLTNYKKIARAAGIKKVIGTHTPRRSGAKFQYRRLIAEGLESFDAACHVQELLHHSDVNTTRKYLGISSVDKFAAAVAFNQVIPERSVRNYKTRKTTKQEVEVGNDA